MLSFFPRTHIHLLAAFSLTYVMTVVASATATATATVNINRCHVSHAMNVRVCKRMCECMCARFQLDLCGFHCVYFHTLVDACTVQLNVYSILYTRKHEERERVKRCNYTCSFSVKPRVYRTTFTNSHTLKHKHTPIAQNECRLRVAFYTCTHCVIVFRTHTWKHNRSYDFPLVR